MQVDSGMVRGDVLVTIDNENEIEAVNRWFNRWGGKIRCTDNKGCGCCVDIFDVEGPAEAFADLPAALRPHQLLPLPAGAAYSSVAK